MTRHVIVGVLGGMGPEATIDLFSKIVHSTDATRDQDHLRLIIDNNTWVPSRQEAILANGPSPLPMLIESARKLATAGAEFIVMPCNTAHHWIEEIRSVVPIPIVDMIQETAKENVRLYPQLKTVGILAATGTVRAGLYQAQFKKLRINTVLPTDDDQKMLMDAIYSVKALGPSASSDSRAKNVGRKLIESGAEAVVAGCTEIPLTLKIDDLSVPIIDATQVLATRAIEIAKGRS